jgi:hypothetical protein
MSRMASDLEREHMRAELWQLIRDVSEVEEIPMAQIRTLADAHVIDVTEYSRAWDKLCEAAWAVVEVAEERMEAANEY